MRVHQLLTSLTYGDAISNEALAIKKFLEDEGIESKIFGYYNHPKVSKYFNHYSSYLSESKPEDILIFHFSIGSPVSKIYFQAPAKKIMIYHNITPYNFFKNYHRILARECYKGRLELKKFVDKTDLGLGDSDYNRRELEELGFDNTGVLPIVMDFRKFDREGSRVIRNMFGDDKFNILFVGRVIPNKKIDEIVRFYAVYQKYFNPNSRLIIAGEYRGFERYLNDIYQTIGKYNLKDVVLTGHISFNDLVALYKEADLYLSFSEHEGFGVPLLEAFYNNVPVIAFDKGAVKETMNGGGIIIKEKKFDKVAALIEELRNNESMREAVLRSQQDALKKYSYENVKKILLSHINNLKEA